MAVGSPTCSALPSPPEPLSVRLPGGITITAAPITPGLVVTDLGNVQALMAQLSPAFAGMAPAMTLIEAVVALFDVVNAIPGLIVGDVQSFTDALSRVAEAVGKLAGMAPQLSVPLAINDGLRAVSAMLRALSASLAGVSSAAARATSVIETAQQSGNAELLAVGRCLEDQAAALTEHALASLGGASVLLTIMGSLSSFVPGCPEIPGLGEITGSADEVIEQLDALAELLDRITIPGA